MSNERVEGGEKQRRPELASTASRPPSYPTVDLGNETADPPTALPRVDAYIGKTFDGRYVIERLLGEGGMGVVYAARHKVIDKRVAVKVLRGEMAKDRDIMHRFLQEARAASAIGNPHIVDISDFGTLPDGSEYFVMELLDGQSLASVLTPDGTAAPGRALPVARIVHIGKQLARALEAAHAAGIVHRDLKPDNVMLVARGAEKDFVKILDFGIAKVGAGPSRITVAGSVFGTPHYMSPEQAAGAPVDHRTDVYSLGVMLYEMAAGRLPFDADNYMGILTQHMYKAPVPIRALISSADVPAGLDAIVLKCMSKKADARYPTMAAVAEDLELLEKGAMPAAVADLMQRSGGFHVPADYFRTGQMPAAVPAMPPRAGRRAWPLGGWLLYSAFAGGAMVLGLLVVVVARGGPSSAPLAAESHAAQPVRNAGTPAPAVSIAAAVAVAAPPPTRQVLVGVDPPDAKVSRDGQSLGEAPIALDVKPGEQVTLVVARDGYKSQSVTIDDALAKRLVKLVAAAEPPRARPRAPARPPQSSPGSVTGDLSDPWKR